MRTRQVTGLVLAAITVVVLVAGLLDPMEGGLAMLAGGILILVTWIVSRVPVPALEIAAWGAAVLLGLVTVAAAALLALSGETGPGRGLPWWLWALLIGYEVAVAVTVAGGIWNLVRHVRILGKRAAT